MERKEWNLKIEKLKAAAQEAEENWRKDLASHIQAVADSEKREEGLKKALAIEKQCVSDVSKMIEFSFLRPCYYSRFVFNCVSLIYVAY